jgi:hypothetical protein
MYLSAAAEAIPVGLGVVLAYFVNCSRLEQQLAGAGHTNGFGRPSQVLHGLLARFGHP